MSKPASAAEEKESRQMSGRYSGSRSRAGSLAQKLASAINQNSFVTETERRARVRAAARQRWIGLTLAFVAVTLLSFCGVLPVLAFNVGASPAAVVAYQGFFATATMPLFVLLARRTGGVQPTRSGWLHIVLVGFFVAATQLCYNLGFFFTEVANVVAFAILAPVWASIMARPVLGERIARRTFVCVIFAISGGLVLCYGNGLRVDGTGTLDARAATGIAFAFGTGLGNACMFTTVSSAVLRAPESEMMIGTTFGFAIQSIAGILLEPILGGPTFALPLWELSSAALGLIAVSGVLVALGIGMSLVACEVVTPAEVTLTFQCEAPFGTLLAFFLLGQLPNAWTLGGAGVIVFAVILHEGAVAYEQRVLLPVIKGTLTEEELARIDFHTRSGLRTRLAASLEASKHGSPSGGHYVLERGSSKLNVNAAPNSLASMNVGVITVRT